MQVQLDSMFVTALHAVSGNIASWKKKEGEAVAAGDEMAEIETDKATMAWEAQDEGFIAKILAKEGSKEIAVGDPVAIFVEEEVSTSRWCGKCSKFAWNKGLQAESAGQDALGPAEEVCS